MKKGDVVLAEFPFSNLRHKKLRPALVVAVEQPDITVAFITSKLTGRQPHDVLLQVATHSGIKVPSLVRTLKLATLDLDLIHGRIGELTFAELQQVNNGLRLGLHL